MSKKRIRIHVNPLSFHQKMETIDFGAIFQNPNQPLCVEIGCGKGVFLRHYAKKHPEKNIIGIEVRRSVVDWLNDRLTPMALGNAVVQHGAGERCLEDQIADGSLESVFVFHPDPWIKDRHQKRRIIRESVIELIAKKLMPEGRLYIATDVESLWEDIDSKMQNSTQFSASNDDLFWQSDYTSHWSEFSKRDGRGNFYATYSRV
ncbi:MAG: tRNA (guanosine(46)-N7)-methyltransferase TrmB [bacterium]|nr:tRNA (guanosine(46)-N7)-methyltransferase TrmB [bacterium]